MVRPRPIHAALAALLIAALTPALPAGATSSSCKLKLRDLTRIEPQSGSYDPFAGTPLPQYHRFEVQHLNGPGCAFVVGVDGGSNGSRQMEDDGYRLSYGLYIDGALSQPLADAYGSPSGLLSGYVEDTKGRDAVELQFFSIIPAGQMVPADTYRDVVRFTLYEWEDGTPGRILDSRTVQVRAKVREVFQASVRVGGITRPLAGVAGTLDLGELSNGAATTFDLEVSGNAGYDVSLESENRGYLVSHDGGGSIPYGLTLDGRSVSLQRSVTLGFGGSNAAQHGLTVTVPAASNALAGTYRDNLVLTVSAR
ncbi:spore coat protein U domain-containing protein [Rhodocista pekingensis]|uniref:Spore coat protein U domain-containing protein n=1 Tax=Rhodocista pekingensis TaxID=201185 RepID=A0ABW2L0P1_9PROT